MIVEKLKTPKTRFEHREGFSVAGLRKQFDAAEKAEGIPALWKAFGPQIGEVANAVTDACYGVIGASNPDGDVDYLAGIKVSSFDGLDKDFDRMVIPDQNYLVVTHEGDVANIQQTWNWIFLEYPKSLGLEIIEIFAMTPEFEVYDARYNAQTKEGEIDIFVPIQPAMIPEK